MDYSRHYNLLISRAQTRILGTQYYETHHIKPKCLGGSNNPSNLVTLTAREHFVAHLLLCELHPTNSKLAYALWAMCILENTDQSRYKPSSRLIEQIRLKIIAAKKQSRWINNGSEDKKVSLSQLFDYIEDGWINGRVQSPTKGKIVINNGVQDYYVDLLELADYLKKGYLKGSIRMGQILGSNPKTKGRVCINNGIKTKRVGSELLNEYLHKGWVKGYHYQIDYSKRKPGGRRKIKL